MVSVSAWSACDGAGVGVGCGLDVVDGLNK
jgi:hypothetical protein